MDKTGLDTLLETIRVLIRLEDFTSGLDVILETLREGLGFEIGEFWRFDSTTDRFELHETIMSRSPLSVEFQEESRKLMLCSGQGIPGYVLNSKKPLVLPDVEKSPIFLRASIFRKANFRSLVALPVIAGDEPLGVFEFLDRTPHPIPEEQLLRVLESLAGHISEFARRTKAEKLANDRAMLLQDVLERLPVGIFVKDRQGVYRYVNRTILSENALTAEEILGRTDVEIFGAEIGADSQLTDDIVRKTGEVSMREIYIDSKTNPRYSLVKKTHLAGFDDEGFDIFGVVTNITRQKKAEESLKLSEQRYRQVVDEQTELICRYRPDGTYTFVNPAFCRFYDKSADELIGKVWQPQVHPDDLDSVLAQVREIGRAHPSKVITSRIIDNKGQMRWLEFVNQAIFGSAGEVVEIQAVGRDVTGRFELEVALQKSETRLRQAMDAAQEAVWEWDVVTQTAFANDHWYRHYGYAPGEIRIGHEFWSSSLHPEDRGIVLSKLADVLAGPSDRFVSEHRIYDKYGNIRWQKCVGAVVGRDEQGRPLRMVGTNMDITDRKWTEEILKQREVFQSAILDFAGVAIVATTVSGKIALFNPEAERMLGYDAEDMIGRLTPECFHDPEEVIRRAAALSAELGTPIEPGFEVFISKARKAKSETREWTYIRKDGLRVPVMLTVSALRDSSGTINGWIGIARDISDSKKAESALRESELQLSNALQLAKAGQWSYDVEADRFTFTDNFYRIFRTTAEKVGGYQLSALEYATKFVHPDELQIVGSEIRNAIETTDPLYFKELEHRFLFADGEVGHLAVRFTLKKDETGKTVQLYGVNQDITKRKLAEAHLHSTLERLRMASEAAQVAIWTWNFDDDSLEWDARMYAIYGLDPSNFSNGIVYQDWYESIHPDDKSKAFDDLIDSLSADGPYFREFRIVRPDGTVRYIQAASVVHSDSDGKPLQMIGINRDITEQRDLERYLTTTKQDAEAANLAKSQFLAHMSHEVRTPLTAVLGYADMLSDRSLSASDSVDAVNSIRRNGSHLLTILDDILDLSKIEAGKMVIEAIPASPWQIAFEAVTLLKIRAADKQVELLVSPDSHLPESCLIDPTRMRQVLVNLLSNAVKFTEPGGKIELSVRSDGDSIVYESRDTGIGLSEEQLTRIFEPFLQADTSTTRKFGGTGLGLTITRKLVEAMHGTITARSEVRKGSCFTVRLPITTSGKGSIRWIMPKELLKSTTLEHQFEQPKIQHPFQGKILLADDSADNRRVIQYMLKRHGLLADVAVNGAQAVTTASQNTYDLILMDMQMPEMDGFTATRLIRESGYDKSIIALTASTMSHDRNKAIEAGCTDFLSKPIEPHAFVEMLSKYLGSVSVR